MLVVHPNPCAEKTDMLVQCISELLSKNDHSLLQGRQLHLTLNPETCIENPKQHPTSVLERLREPQLAAETYFTFS